MKINNRLFRFLLRGLLLFLLWYFVYDLWLRRDRTVDDFLNQTVAYSSHVVLKFLGYDSCISDTEVCISQMATVNIGRGCNGLELYALFAGFIIIFPGNWKKKLLYILLGIAVIFALNTGRVTMLAIDNYSNKEWFTFNHKYTYLFIIYLAIFGMWVLWVNKFSSLAGQ